MPTSTITYSDFTFPYTTLTVTQRAMFADDRITQIGTEHTFGVSGFISCNTVADMTAKLAEIQCKLSQPRGEFKVQWEDADGPQTYYQFNGSSGSAFVDDGWGPFPGDFQIGKIFGGRAIAYNWSIRCYRKDCFGDDCSLTDRPVKILALFRRFSHAVDESGFTTRTVSGKLITDRAGAPADKYRNDVINTTPLPAYFRRVRQEFQQSEDGRELQFTIVDQEQMWTLPLPMTAGQVSFTVKVADLGLRTFYGLSGFFEAPASVSKATILNRIWALATAKFPIGTPGHLFESWDFRESIYDRNRIDFDIQSSAGGGNTASGGSSPAFTAGLSSFLNPPPNSTGASYWISPYGGDGVVTSGVMASKPTLYDACNPVEAETPPPIGTAGGSGQSGSNRDNGNIGTENDGVSDDHLNAQYVAYHEQISYELDNGVVVFDPKVKGKAPIVQQTRTPSMTIIQAGYASRYAKSAIDGPRIPKPVIQTDGDSANAVMLTNFTSPASPEPIGDGTWSRWTIHWRYVMRFTREITTGGSGQQSQTQDRLHGLAEARWPYDPRRPADGSGQSNGRGPSLDVGVVPLIYLPVDP